MPQLLPVHFLFKCTRGAEGPHVTCQGDEGSETAHSAASFSCLPASPLQPAIARVLHLSAEKIHCGLDAQMSRPSRPEEGVKP